MQDIVGPLACGSAGAADGVSAWRPERSDIDELVQYKYMPAGAYVELREVMEGLVGRRVDLVTVASMTNLLYRESVERTRVPLCTAA